MPTKYDAVLSAVQNPVAEPAFARPASAHNHLATVLVVLSLVSAIGLVYAAFFTDRGQVSRAPQAAPSTSITSPLIHPRASGLPEAALFLRHRPLEEDVTVLVR